MVHSDVKKKTRFIQHARKKVIYNPQHLQVVILECAVEGILPIGLMQRVCTTKDAQRRVMVPEMLGAAEPETEARP